MKAMILAAGRGERMRPLTDKIPKPLVCVGGRPLIDYHLRALQRAGFKEVVINTAYLGEMIEQFVGDGSQYHLTVNYSREEQALETGGGVKQALALLGEGPFLLVNADVWTDFNYAKLKAIDWAKLENVQGYLVLVDNPPFKARGDFCLQQLEGEHICRVQCVSQDKQSVDELTFSGVSVLTASLFANSQDVSFPLVDVFRQAISVGVLAGEHYSGEWFDIGTPQRLAELEEKLTASY